MTYTDNYNTDNEEDIPRSVANMAANEDKVTSTVKEQASTSGTKEKPIIKGRVAICDHVVAYKKLWTRFTSRRHIYEIAAVKYKNDNFMWFTIPVILLQMSNIILLQFFEAEEATKTLIVTLSSGLASLIVAAQTKLKWGEMGQQFEKAATEYSMLKTMSYFRMMQAQVDCDDFTYEERCKRVLDFMDETQKTEETAIKTCPDVPRYIINIVTRRERKIEALQDKAVKVGDKPGTHEDAIREKAMMDKRMRDEPDIYRKWASTNVQKGVDGQVSAKMRNNMYDNCTIDEYGHLLLPLEVTGAFRQLWQRYFRKKMRYNLSGRIYKVLDLTVFTLPLLTLQMVNTVAPSVLSPRPDLVKIITTCVAAVSAFGLACQAKLRWGEIGEKFHNIATQYGVLTSESYFKMVESKIIEGIGSDKELKSDVIGFIGQAKKAELNAETLRPVAKTCIGPMTAAYIERCLIAKEIEKPSEEHLFEESDIQKPLGVNLVKKVVDVLGLNHETEKDIKVE